MYLENILFISAPCLSSINKAIQSIGFWKVAIIKAFNGTHS